MTDFTKHSEILVDLEAIQSAEEDMRTAAREAQLFIHKRDGQWETDVLDDPDRPRYTFDMTGPLIDQIAGEIENADFSIQVLPAGGGATQPVAKVLDGMIRNIENVSGASEIYDQSSRYMVESGFDGWEVKQKYADGDSFDQDLIIEPISNFIDSVWFWPFRKWDASDAQACVKLEAIPIKDYKRRWPDGSCESVDSNRLSDSYFNKNEHIIVGQLYYLKKISRELLLLSDGRVVEAEEAAPVLDELAAQGITVEKRRKRDRTVQFTRLFDGKDWLGASQETVFNRLSVVPMIANFANIEHKMVWRGAVERLMDPQRVFNYSKSREVEEGALSPREKIWLTQKQAAGHESTLATLNTNSDPVQLYNPDPEAPGAPIKTNGATINPGLKTLSDDMSGMMRNSAGLYAASLGDNPNVQSGIAITKLQDKGRLGSAKYFKAAVRAIRTTGKLLVDAIPHVYDTRRQERVMNEDGSFDMVALNTVVFDQQTGQLVTVNDLSVGKYDVVCTAGPSFKNRQQETVAAITDIGTVDPSFVELGGDILAKNISAPGMDLLAQRKRQQLFQAGMIPASQQTDEEKALTQQAQQNPPPPDAATRLAMAEEKKAEAQAGRVMVQAQSQQRQENRKDAQLQISQQQQQFDQFMEQQRAGLEQQQAATDQLNTQANTLKLLIEALTPAAPAVTAQRGVVIDAQSEQ